MPSLQGNGYKLLRFVQTHFSIPIGIQGPQEIPRGVCITTEKINETKRSEVKLQIGKR